MAQVTGDIFTLRMGTKEVVLDGNWFKAYTPLPSFADTEYVVVSFDSFNVGVNIYSKEYGLTH